MSDKSIAQSKLEGDIAKTFEELHQTIITVKGERYFHSVFILFNTYQLAQLVENRLEGQVSALFASIGSSMDFLVGEKEQDSLRKDVMSLMAFHVKSLAKINKLLDGKEG